MTDVEDTSRERLRNTLCTALHRAETGEWDGGEGNCPRCRLMADKMLPEVVDAFADWIRQHGTDAFLADELRGYVS